MVMREPSKLFVQVFMGCGGGTPRAQCGCGRICFSDSLAYDADEKESLLERMSEKPSHYVYMNGDDGVSVYELLGRTYVWGCSCDYAAHVEDMLVAGRDDIMKYLRMRAAVELAEATARMEKLG